MLKMNFFECHRNISPRYGILTFIHGCPGGREFDLAASKCQNIQPIFPPLLSDTHPVVGDDTETTADLYPPIIAQLIAKLFAIQNDDAAILNWEMALGQH